MPKKFMQSFKYARLGAGHALRHERNLWIHSLLGLAALAAAAMLQFTPIELAVVVLTIALVIVTEMINTAIEEVVDLAQPERHPAAALAKNIAAGASLSAAAFSAVIGLLLYLPRVLK